MLLLAGCPRTVTLTPIVDVPPRIPFLIARDVRAALAAANRADVDAPPWRIAGGHEAAGHLVEHYRLGRGIHLVLSIDRDAGAFTHQIWFDARNIDPASGAALIELYRDRPGSDRMRAYELAGARTTAGISRELGFFAATAPAKLGDVDTLARITKLEAERLARKRSSRSALVRAASPADPRQRVERVMIRALNATLEAEARPELTEELLEELAKDAFAPQRLVVVLAGDVDRTRALTLLREAHASRGSAEELREDPPKLRASAPAFPMEVQIPADDAELLMAWTIDPRENGLELEAAAHVLAGGEPSRLGAKLGSGVAGIRARAPEGARTLEVTLILEPATTSTKAVGKVREAIDGVVRGDSIEKELARAKSRMTREVLEKASGLESRAELFASALLMAGSLDAIDLRLFGLMELSAEAVRSAVKKELASRNPAMVLGVPEEGS
jgi:hypothetical protein